MTEMDSTQSSTDISPLCFVEIKFRMLYDFDITYFLCSIVVVKVVNIYL